MPKHPQIKRYFDPGYDGVVEAVRLTTGEKIKWVRAYERRGPTWSDHLILDRATLVDRIKSGQRFVTGKRIPNMGSEFEVSDPIELGETSKGEVIRIVDTTSNKDALPGVPVI